MGAARLVSRFILGAVGNTLSIGGVYKLGFSELFERVKMPMTVNSPTACGRSPLGEGALGRG